MHSRRLTALAATALVISLAGCAPNPSSSPAASATQVAASASRTAAPAAAHPKPTPTKKAADYPALAKRWIDENACYPGGPSECKDIKSYGMIVDALVAHTDLYPDSDATAPAGAICGYLLMYVVNSKVSPDDVSSTAYVYGSTGSRITDCTTPMDR